jgi:hypothetical protein
MDAKCGENGWGSSQTPSESGAKARQNTVASRSYHPTLRRSCLALGVEFQDDPLLVGSGKAHVSDGFSEARVDRANGAGRLRWLR